MSTAGHADARLVRALSHPLRHSILEMLATSGESSPVRMAHELGQPLSTVSHQVRILRDLECIELVRSEPRRGALEHFYRATELPFLTDEDWDRLPRMLRRGLAAQTLRLIFASAAEAGSGGGFDRPGAHLIRMSLTLDARGWEELSELVADTLKRVEALQDASRSRLNPTAEARPVSSELVFMHFACQTPSENVDGRRPRLR
jgi:DNA-binding transcriptional ArsR family regulator